jgi:hypothetical protein
MQSAWRTGGNWPAFTAQTITRFWWSC